MLPIQAPLLEVDRGAGGVRGGILCDEVSHNLMLITCSCDASGLWLNPDASQAHVITWYGLLGV